ncbi:MBL fold metallo-hydrolase [Cereibacter sphaeroides]|nr:MBL fold metallo-hydrolase [Cereibacter sphaeroides]
MPRNRYYSGPPSDHFDGTRFFNPGGEAPRGFRDMLRWQREGQRQQWPARVPVTKARPEAQVADLTITMVGHATLLIQTAGLNLLTDPVWSERASPFQFAGPRRVADPGIDFAHLPKIDAVLLSHNHYDHLDLLTLKRLKAAHDPVVLTPLGNDAILKGTGLRVQTADWGEVLHFGPLAVHLEPCHHWSARGTRDRSMALWAAFVIEGPSGKILHIGDTGFDEGRPYRDLPARHGPLRAAILPIGAYEPRWFMRAQHQDPHEALQGFRLSGARWGVGHHWGTFQLTDEDREAPPVALTEALTAQNVAADAFRALAPGESWAIPPL